MGRRGRRTGEQRTLSSDQESELRKAVIDKTPDQLKLPFALWTRDAVKLLVRQLFDIEVPIRTVGEYLKRWGFTPQTPVKRAYEQSSQVVKKWLDTDYPVIASRAKEEKVEIHWGDETGIQTGANRVRGFAPKGETPVISMVAKKSRVSMISAITNGGKVRFIMYQEAMNSGLLIKFVNRLIKDAGRKVFLIRDNLRVHHGKTVKQRLEEHREQIEVDGGLKYLPRETALGKMETMVEDAKIMRADPRLPA